MEYNWNFSCLECYPQKEENKDVVFLVHWQYTGKKQVDGKEYQNTVIGTQNVPLPQDSFVPFEDLTKEMVQGWVEAEMGEERMIAMKESIEKQIDNQINPPVLQLSPPWN